MPDFPVINENLLHALAAFSWVSPRGEVTQHGGLSLVFAGVPHGLFNTALVTAPVPGPFGDFADLLTVAGRYFRERGVPWSIWFCEDFFTDDERRRSRITLASWEMHPVMEAPGMIAPRLAPQDRQLPSLDCQRVADQRTRDDFSRVMALAYAVQENMSREIYAGAGLWEGNLRGWVGYADGQAVSIAATVTAAGSVGVYAVATHPDRQMRGYGEAITRRAVREAQREFGVDRTVLQSSAAGYRLYVKLGYRNVTKFSVYATG